MKTNPIACPFCATISELLVEDFSSGYYAVQCNECGARGPFDTDETLAVTLWNLRPVLTAEEINPNRESKNP